MMAIENVGETVEAPALPLEKSKQMIDSFALLSEEDQLSILGQVEELLKKSGQMKKLFVLLSEENQNFILGQAEGLRAAQDMLNLPVSETLYTGAVTQ